MSGKKLTREQAHELYDNLHKAMGHLLVKKDGAGAPQGTATKEEPTKTAQATKTVGRSAYAGSKGMQKGRSPKFSSWQGALSRGNVAAIMTVVVFCCAKVALSALEVAGVGKVEEAQAVIVRPATGPQWSKEEVKILTALDARRVEIEERAARIEQRESDIAAREREMVIRLAELKELTAKLKLERDKGDKQKDAQLDQLANVYGSMNPPEAAQLLGQLDIQVALSLIERMPEKRMGQILSLMSPERALQITNLLSQRKPKA